MPPVGAQVRQQRLQQALEIGAKRLLVGVPVVVVARARHCKSASVKQFLAVVVHDQFQVCLHSGSSACGEAERGKRLLEWLLQKHRVGICKCRQDIVSTTTIHPTAGKGAILPAGARIAAGVPRGPALHEEHRIVRQHQLDPLTCPKILGRLQGTDDSLHAACLLPIGMLAHQCQQHVREPQLHLREIFSEGRVAVLEDDQQPT
mmetsp:Transcript_13231/g.31328  ORF Transcript_13231/g.31328 Transcript_13231/m.31328 type:complete len:204 (-) Transcript_13231:493-1104(-)